jgi:phosphoribosyl 1,2-cyclic phosphodiesterase
MQMCVLASGSSGNCTIVRLGGSTFMIDAGIGPRAAGRRLAGTGVQVRDIRAILLTHLDSDHFRPTWLPTVEELNIPIHIDRRHLHDFYRVCESEARRLHRKGLVRIFNGEPFDLGLGDRARTSVRTIRCDHDESGTVSYRIEAPDGRLALATDVGRVTDPLVEALTNVDLLAIESNYDPPMQKASSRPWHLKNRIMGGRGHLSNDQAFEAVRRAVVRSARPPQHIVLLHLSRQCNRPALARQAFAGDRTLSARLCLTSQHQRTDWLRITAGDSALLGEQLVMW